MQAEFFWELFCETGAPEVYLLLHDSPLNGGKLKT